MGGPILVFYHNWAYSTPKALATFMGYTALRYLPCNVATLLAPLNLILYRILGSASAPTGPVGVAPELRGLGDLLPPKTVVKTSRPLSPSAPGPGFLSRTPFPNNSSKSRGFLHPNKISRGSPTSNKASNRNSSQQDLIPNRCVAFGFLKSFTTNSRLI